MANLHLTKVAFGCRDLASLQSRIAGRVLEGEVRVTTRMRPKRADELIGGSLYWIVKHRIAARQTILGFAEREEDQRTIIRLDPALVVVKARPKRAHQGWRYLPAADAPGDLAGDDGGLGELPVEMAVKLAALALI